MQWRWCVSIRTRRAVVIGNTITGSYRNLRGFSAYGIAAFEGWAVDLLIRDNVVSTFTFGVRVIDGAEPGQHFKWIGANISDNVISNINTGVWIGRASENKFLYSTGVTITRNTFRNFYGSSGKVVRVSPYVAGVWITNNVVDGTASIDSNGVPQRSSATNGCFYFEENAGNNSVIKDNQVLNFAGSPIWIANPSESDLVTVAIGQNLINNSSTTSFNIGENVSIQPTTNYGSFHPFQDNLYTLGWSGRRWNRVFSVNGVQETSDMDKKQDIKDECLGLDFVNSLRPVTYKFKDGNEVRHGVVAQDVLRSLEKFDGKGIVFQDSTLSIEYTQLISILIKSVQDLSAMLQKESETEKV